MRRPPAQKMQAPGAVFREGKQRRIALFTGAYNHIADGVSLTLNRLVAHLEKEGAEVLVFAPTAETPAVDHAGNLVPVPSISAPGRPDYRIARGLPRDARERLREFRPTLVHIATPDLLGLAARRLALNWKTPIVASYHTHFSSYLKYYRLSKGEGLMWRYLRYFYGPCEQLYVPSLSMMKVLRGRGISNDMRLWARGVDTEHFHPEQYSVPWRRCLGFDENDVVVTFVGRLVWEKGLDVFAEVVERLHARGVRIRSMLVGEGPARSDLANRLPRTRFTGHLDGDELARAYASSNIFFFPSDTETFGNVTLEAMASGLPALCADATGSNTLVEHDATGFLAPAGNVEAFVHYAERLATEPMLRRRMGRQARERALHYEWENVLRRITRYYDEVLTPGSSVTFSGNNYRRRPRPQSGSVAAVSRNH